MRVIGLRRTIMINVGLSSNFAHLEAALDHAGCRLRDIDMVVLSHEHLDHVGAAWHFGKHTIVAAHRLAANKIMLRDDFAMLRKMFNEPNVAFDVDLWLEEGNLIDLGNFRPSACISLLNRTSGCCLRQIP